MITFSLGFVMMIIINIYIYTLIIDVISCEHIYIYMYMIEHNYIYEYSDIVHWTYVHGLALKAICTHLDLS